MIEPVICLGGPTGSGKTRLALLLAHHFNCEIINTDSRQVYKEFPIITAQPSEAERNEVCHHLYGFLPATRAINAGQWLEYARAAANNVLKRGKIPLFTGGTGFYFKAMLHGLAEIPQVSKKISEFFYERIEKEGSPRLHAELERIDPLYARRVHPNDRHRIQRALEVWQETGRTFTWWHHNSRPQPQARGPLLVIAKGLSDLEPVLVERIDKMIAQGAIGEAREALKCHPDINPGWSGIGCAELRSYLKGEISLEECRKLWAANTRAYAKRQLTWFKAQKNIIAIDPAAPGRVIDQVAKWQCANSKIA